MPHYLYKHIISTEREKYGPASILFFFYYITVYELVCLFVQTADRLQSQEVEECSRCDIEILNTGPRFDDTARLSNPEPLDTQISCGSQSSPSPVSLSCVPLQGDYCPQSVIVLWEEQALQQMTCFSSKSYFRNTEQDMSEVNKLSERVEIM